jgi:hypothetical protein
MFQRMAGWNDAYARRPRASAFHSDTGAGSYADGRVLPFAEKRRNLVPTRVSH